MSDLAPTGTEPTGEVTPEVDPFDSPDTTTFDRKYVEKLRNEAAQHRTEKQKYAGAFQGWDDDAQSVWLDTIAQAAADPKTGAAALREIAKILGGDEETTATTTAPTATDVAAATKVAAEAGLSRTELEQILAKRDEEIAIAAEIRGVEAEAKTLGYEKGTEAYYRLLWLTANKTKMNMAAAHQMIKDEKDAVVAEYLKSKAPKTAGAAPAGGAATADAKQIKTLKDASSSAMERIRAANSRN